MREKIKKIFVFFRDWDNQSRYIKWMTAKTKPFFGSLMLVLAMDLLVTIAGIGGTIITKYIIDGVTGTSSVITAKGVIILVLLTAVGIGVGAIGTVITALINERFTFGIRTTAYENILHGVWQKITSFHSGDIVTRLTSDINSISNGIASIIPNFFFLIARLIIAFCVLYCYDHFLAVAALLLGPVGALLSLAFSGRLKKYQEEINKTESEYRSFLQETVENVTVIKSFERERDCSEQLSLIQNRRLCIIVKRNKLSAIMNICIRLVFGAGYLVAFCWGIYRLSTNSITYGTMTVFLSLVAQVQTPIMSLGSIIPQFVTILASAGRVIEMDSVQGETLLPSKLCSNTPRVGLKIQNVTFGYGREMVLKDVSLNFKPKDIVGIVGYSGSGKTTLVRLILSLVYPQEKGKLFLYNEGGMLEEVSAATRRFISYVPQGNTLLSGTIADNLRAGKQDATEAEIWSALEIADAAKFVREQKEGLSTIIGEKAVGLSEGQAQRIAIARAVIKNAPIMILDEATSALDAETEEKVLCRMRDSGLLGMCIIITHRRSMLRYCTRALEIDDQQVKEIKLA